MQAESRHACVSGCLEWPYMGHGGCFKGELFDNFILHCTKDIIID
jgi:hypothetical protein